MAAGGAFLCLILDAGSCFMRFQRSAFNPRFYQLKADNQRFHRVRFSGFS